VDRFLGFSALSLESSSPAFRHSQAKDFSNNDSMGGYITVGSWNSCGFTDATVAEIVSFFSEHRCAVIGLQDIGGNRDEPAAARLHAAREELAGHGISFATGLGDDSCVAILWSTELGAEETGIGRSDHSCAISLRAETPLMICSVYWRPVGSARAITITELDHIATSAIQAGCRLVLLGDLNCGLKAPGYPEEPTVINTRQDSRSRQVAGWLNSHGMTTCTVEEQHSWQQGDRQSAPDHVIVSRALAPQTDRGINSSTPCSDHDIIRARIRLDVNPLEVPRHLKGPACKSWKLPPYGDAVWHWYGKSLASKAKKLLDELPPENTILAPSMLQEIATKLTALLQQAPVGFFQERKAVPKRKPRLPPSIQRAKQRLRRWKRQNQWHGGDWFKEGLNMRKQALQVEIRRHRNRREMAFAARVAPQLHTLASRQAWGEVKKALGRGKSGTTLREQAEVLNAAGEPTSDVRSAAKEALQYLLGEADAHMVPDSALQRLHDLKTQVSEPPFLGDNSDFDRSAPAVEGEYPRTPWQFKPWGTGNAEGFSPEFVQAAIRQVATQSAGGPDRIVAEMLRWVDSHRVAIRRGEVPEGAVQENAAIVGEPHWRGVCNLLARIFNCFVHNSFIPAEWKESYTTMLYKGKGERRNLNNYRAIAAGSTLGKVFSQCVLYCLEGWATVNGVLSTQQRGFRCHRGCEDNLAALLTALRAKRCAGADRQRAATTHLVFVDFSKAYDRVPHSAMLKKLEILGATGKILQLIKGMLQGTTTRIHTAEGLSDPISVKRGLPQGHTISPMLFALYLNDLLVELQQNKTPGARPVDLQDIACLAYADDVVILADSAEEAQKQLDSVRRWAEDWGMQVNLSKGKTEHMIIGPPQESPLLSFGQDTVKQTDQYKYLGVTLSSADRMLKLPATRKAMLAAAWGAHASIMRLKVAAPDLPPGVLATVWQTWVLPQLMYGIGVWMDGEDWPDAQKFMHICGRQLLDAPGETPNSVVMAELGWRTVSFWIRYHRCRTLSRMLRAPQNDLTHLTLQTDMILKKDYPRQSWLVGTIAILNKGTLDGGELTRLNLFLSNRLKYVDFSDRQAVGAELDRLMLEKTWCNSVLHDEFEAWSTEVHRGATRNLYDTFVSERRDRGHAMEPKPRWATVTRPPKSLRHISSKSDAKLLTATRMGDRRSLSAHLNANAARLGHNCPCCNSAIDTAPHMLQCPAIKTDLRVQEAIEQLRSSMHGRPIRVKGSGDREVGLLVDFLQVEHMNMGAEQVLLGSCSNQAVPANLRSLYRALHNDRQLHALWLKGTVAILRACWAVHDAAVDDALSAAGAGQAPPPPPPRPSRQDRLRVWQKLGLPGEPSLVGNGDLPGLVAGYGAPMEAEPGALDGAGEMKEEEDAGPLAEQKVPHDGDDAPQLRGLGDLVRPPAPPHDPQPGLPLGLASLLLPAAAPAPAMLPPASAALGARSLMDVLVAAPRGLMSLLSMGTQDNHNDDNCP